METHKIRKLFLDFFVEREHILFTSDGLIPQADPTVLFTSAGMNQFKDYFLGAKKGIRRACSSQKCLRTDDLDKVGKTPYHHTFFEMLGNFSFGDYFKKEAIVWAYEFVTRFLNIGKDRIWISVYEKDDESYNIWRKEVGISRDKIIKLGMDTNFWPANAPLQGPNGPCGPCSELFFDRGKDKGCLKPECNPSCSCSRFIELWNLVFTQYNRVDKNRLEPLPQKNIDTGMGLERIACVLQNKENNFQIDIFTPIIEFILESISENKVDNSLVNAVGDHLRAVVFAISEGIIPSNESRGYVIRKLLRRALVFSYLMGNRRPFLYKGVYVVSRIYQDIYKEIDNNRENISLIIKTEEERFLDTLDNAREYLKEVFKRYKESSRWVLSDQDCFKLYDTFGLPLEIIEVFAQRDGLRIDKKGFLKILEKAKQRTRKESRFEGQIFKERKEIPPSEFWGYTHHRLKAEILKIYLQGKEENVINVPREGEIILSRTPFYGESGGQVGDRGFIKKIDEQGNTISLFEVKDTIREGKSIIHKGKMLKGSLRRKEEIVAQIEVPYREAIMRAHTSTHLLQSALRKILGSHVKQAGSLVEADRLRFDFSHFKALTPQEIELVEEEVNSKIREDISVKVEMMPLWEAKKTPALAFFEEKYEDTVRVVNISSWSRELCGGTHLSSTGKIGLFKIVKEQALQSGVRRIEAYTGKKALELFSSSRKILESLSALLRVPPQEVEEAVNSILKEIKQLSKKIKDSELLLFRKEVNRVLEEAWELKGIKLYLREFRDKPLEILRGYIDIISQELKEELVVLLIRALREGTNILIYVSPGVLSRGISALKILDALSKALHLKGGGREEFVQAGSSQRLNLDKVKKSLEEALRDLL